MADMDVRRGQMVYGSHGNALGRVLQCDDSGFVIQQGLVFTEDYAVAYDDVAWAKEDEVHLRVPGSALLEEREADAWNPSRDSIGTAGGTDIEPLRAGMAEIDEYQAAGGVLDRGEDAARSRRERRREQALAEEALRNRRAEAGGRPQGASVEQRRYAAVPDGELEKHITEEVEDFEREASCETREAPAERRRARAAARRARAAQRATLRQPVPGAAGEPGREPSPRIDYRTAAPEAFAAMRQLDGYVRRCGLELTLLELVRLRASQINGCAFCIDMHTKDARRAGETEQRLYTLQVWRETPFFTDRERAALAWTEAVTRLGADRIDEDTFRFAREQFSEAEMVNLTMAIVAINGWNRLAIAFRAEPGSYQPADEDANRIH